MITTFLDLKNHRNHRIAYTSVSLCNALKTESTITPFVIFSMAFIWHCHLHFGIDLFDNNDDQHSNIDNLYLKYPNISNKEMLNTFFINSKSVFKSIKKTHMKQAIKLFEADNGELDNIPHGYIASTYNIKRITDSFTKYMNYALNDDDIQMLSHKLSCR